MTDVQSSDNGGIAPNQITPHQQALKNKQAIDNISYRDEFIKQAEKMKDNQSPRPEDNAAAKQPKGDNDGEKTEHTEESESKKAKPEKGTTRDEEQEAVDSKKPGPKSLEDLIKEMDSSSTQQLDDPKSKLYDNMEQVRKNHKEFFESSKVEPHQLIDNFLNVDKALRDPDPLKRTETALALLNHYGVDANMMAHVQKELGYSQHIQQLQQLEMQAKAAKYDGLKNAEIELSKHENFKDMGKYAPTISHILEHQIGIDNAIASPKESLVKAYQMARRMDDNYFAQLVSAATIKKVEQLMAKVKTQPQANKNIEVANEPDDFKSVFRREAAKRGL